MLHQKPASPMAWVWVRLPLFHMRRFKHFHALPARTYRALQRAQTANSKLRWQLAQKLSKHLLKLRPTTWIHQDLKVTRGTPSVQPLKIRVVLRTSSQGHKQTPNGNRATKLTSLPTGPTCRLPRQARPWWRSQRKRQPTWKDSTPLVTRINSGRTSRTSH